MKEELKVKENVNINMEPMGTMPEVGAMPQMQMMPQMMPMQAMPQMQMMPQPQMAPQMPMICCPFLMNMQCPMLYNQGYMGGMGLPAGGSQYMPQIPQTTQMPQYKGFPVY